jgi:hypothetical protein
MERRQKGGVDTMRDQEASPVDEYAARDLILKKVEEIAFARGYAFWANYVDQINYWDYSSGDEVGLEIMRVDGRQIFDGEPVIGVSISAMQGDVTTEKAALLWLRPEDMADNSRLDMPKWLCEYEPYALEEAQMAKSRPLSYWMDKAGAEGAVQWVKKAGDRELSVELTFTTNQLMRGETKGIRILIDDIPPSTASSRSVEVQIYMP